MSNVVINALIQPLKIIRLTSVEPSSSIMASSFILYYQLSFNCCRKEVSPLALPRPL